MTLPVWKTEGDRKADVGTTAASLTTYCSWRLKCSGFMKNKANFEFKDNNNVIKADTEIYF